LAGLAPVFGTAGESPPDEKTGLNIEGLAWDPPRGRLLIGFRNPRHKHHALVVAVDNPDGVFDHAAEPSLEAPVSLDLDGEGIRDLTFSPTLGGILILAGAWRGHLQTRPSLWLWTEGRKPEQLRAPVLDDLRPEGIAEVQHDGRRGLLVVSDDGNQDELYLRG